MVAAETPGFKSCIEVSIAGRDGWTLFFLQFCMDSHNARHKEYNAKRIPTKLYRISNHQMMMPNTVWLVLSENKSGIVSILPTRYRIKMEVETTSYTNSDLLALIFDLIINNR